MKKNKLAIFVMWFSAVWFVFAAAIVIWATCDHRWTLMAVNTLNASVLLFTAINMRRVSRRR